MQEHGSPGPTYINVSHNGKLNEAHMERTTKTAEAPQEGAM